MIGPALGGGRGVATLGAGGTIASAAFNTVLNGILLTGALEAGIAIGSTADALGKALADDSQCNNACGAR
jgi:hypothetical protein